MKTYYLFFFVQVILLFFQICSANVIEDLDNVYPLPFYASFEQSNTNDSIKTLLSTFALQGKLTGLRHGNSIVNGYAQIVGAMTEYKGSDEPWFKEPFIWLNNNQAMIPEILKRNGYKITAEHILFANYLLSSYKTITEKPDWKIRFQKIKLLYSQFQNDWKEDTIEHWVQENNFLLTHSIGDDRKHVIPDFIAWGLAENWIGAKTYPAVFNSASNKKVLWCTNISFENYLASFWYRRWVDGSMNTVYTTLKLVSAVIPRNFEKQKSKGFVDSIPETLSRTGEDWELYPIPTSKITCLRVKEDGKTRVDSIWSAVVPTAVKIVDLMPPVKNYYLLDDSLLTPDSEGVVDTLTIKFAPIETSSMPANLKVVPNTKNKHVSLNSKTDLSKFVGSDPISTINNLTKTYDPYMRFFSYHNNLLKFNTPDVKVEIILSDVKLQVVNGKDSEFHIQFICKDGSKCVKCNYSGPTSITAITVKNKDAAEKIVAEIEKLRNR